MSIITTEGWKNSGMILTIWILSSLFPVRFLTKILSTLHLNHEYMKEILGEEWKVLDCFYTHNYHYKVFLDWLTS